VVDTSHLSMAGVEQIAGIGLPLVPAYPNAQAIAPGARNLTDAQLRAIGATGGMVGLNLGAMSLDPAGRANAARALDAGMNHLGHMIAFAGEICAGPGSDSCGAPIPEGLGSVADPGNFRRKLRERGYGAALIEGICNRNWLDFRARYCEE